MIRLPGPATLSEPDRRSLTLLADLARLIPVADANADVVSIEVTDRPPTFATLHDWRRAGWGIEPGDAVVRIARASLRCIAAIVAATQEAETTLRDHFDRVPSAANALVAEGLEREPIVSLAAVALRNATVTAAGRRVVRVTVPWPDGRRWAVALTHDLDVVAWWPVFTGLRLLELLRKAHVGRATHVLAAAAGAAGRNPVRQGVDRLLAAEAARSVRSTWFVLCGTPSWRTFLAGDLTYRPESAVVRDILMALTTGGHAVGLHGSQATVRSGAVFGAQRRRLEALLGRIIPGVRQHFLRFDPQRTPQAMREGGFRYDSTSGFADRNGFRLGVADIVPLWEATDAPAEPLAEVPFAWMDRALSKYRGVEDPDTWITDATALAGAARAVEGLWVGVWHPNLVPALGYPDAPSAYERLLDSLLADRPYVGTLDDLVSWREARRRLQIHRMAPDGRIDVGAGGAIPLEEARR